jgi:predicted phosphate transport protein (TIGR00153 family)
LSELFKWFEKRRETKVLRMMERHLALTMSAVEDLENAVKAMMADNESKMRLCIDRVTKAENEADQVRREVMNELACGELSSAEREDLMHLVKRVDRVADWSRESTRILNATPIKEVPENLKKACGKMVEGVRECALALRKCISQLAEKPEEALAAADQVERLEEKVDDFFEESRQLLAKETKIRIGVAILISDLLEAIEMVADWCEDTCDQVRIIAVRQER